MALRAQNWKVILRKSGTTK